MLTSGEQVDRYQVDGLVGSGGMAHVYRVRHVRLGSAHAVKLLRLPTPSVIDRLLREGRAQSTLRHPNIVPVTDVIDVRGAPGLVMEWVEGPNLAQLLGAGPLSPSEIHAVATGLFAGIEAAHAAGWVHRDLKPANVLLQPLVDRLVPRVTDFGLVKTLVGHEDPAGHTFTGAVMGTPAYMAPEQLLDTGGVDHRADVWALGVLLYELCTNVRPFDASDPAGLIAAHGAPVPPIAAHRDDLPPSVASAVGWALQTDPSARPPSVAALAARWSEGPWPAGPSPWDPSTLALAAALVPTVRAEEPPDDSRTLSVGSDLFGPASPDPAPPAQEPSSLAERSEQRPARWLAGIVGSAAITAVALAVWRGPGATPAAEGPPVLTVTDVPVISGDPAAQEQLALGWQSFLQGDRTEALRRLESPTLAEVDSPLPELLRSYVQLRDEQLGASLQTSRDALRRWPDHPGPHGELLRMVGAQQQAGSVDVPEVDAHLRAWPDDLLAALMAADHCAMVSASACERYVPALLGAAPRSPLTYQVAAESWQEFGDVDRARRTILAGLEVAYRDPTLLDLLARDGLQRGDHAEARATLDALREVDPSAEPPRLLRVRLSLLEGDAATFDALRAELTSPSQRLATRLAFFDAAVGTLRGLGRLELAATLQEQALALGAREGSPADAFLLHLGRREIAWASGDLDGVIAHLEAASAIAAANPEVPRPQRDRLTGNLLWARGIQALENGDLATAEAQLERLRGAEGVAPDSVEALAREVAVHRGDVEAVLGLGQTLWQGECHRGAVLGDAVLRAGDPARAVPLLEGAVAAGCTRYTQARGTEVLALIALAEAHLALGRSAEARRRLAAARALWPDADPTHPLVVRGDVVQSALDGGSGGE